jgi:hypothetical protein
VKPITVKEKPENAITSINNHIPTSSKAKLSNLAETNSTNSFTQILNFHVLDLNTQSLLVINATTTPVINKNQYNKNAVIKRYNEVIVPLLEQKGIIINDLYTPIAADVDKYIRADDKIHLTQEGIELTSQMVAESILRVAATLEDRFEDKPEVKQTTFGLPI